MREILFRGKRVDNNEWVYGFLSKSRGNNHFLSLCIDHEENGVMLSSIVEPETIGQYTGLCDKNGVKIFEGDIVRYGDTIHEVVFEQRNGTAYFGLVYSKIETLPFGHYQDLKQIEVIGNIYDNSEFTKGE